MCVCVCCVNIKRERCQSIKKSREKRQQKFSKIWKKFYLNRPVVGGLLNECLRRSNPGVSWISLDIALDVVGVSLFACIIICLAIFLVVVVVVVVVIAAVFLVDPDGSNLCIRACCCCCRITEDEDRSCKNADEGHEFKSFFPLFLHEEEFCKIFKELNAVDGAFCLSVSKRGFVLLFLLLLLEEKPPFISSKSPSSSNSSSLNASSSDRGRLWETRTRGVFSTPPLEMESSIFFFFCVSSEERSSVRPLFWISSTNFSFCLFITFCVCSVFLQNCGAVLLLFSSLLLIISFTTRDNDAYTTTNKQQKHTRKIVMLF